MRPLRRLAGYLKPYPVLLTLAALSLLAAAVTTLVLPIAAGRYWRPALLKITAR